MYILYYMPGACSLAVHVALNEVGADYKLVNVGGEAERKKFLAVNPRGKVPVLEHDGAVQREGAAILITLLDDHQSPLLPQTGPERAAALEWLCFANASLHPAYGAMFMLHHVLSDKVAENPLYDGVIANIQKLWDDIEQRLNQSAYLAGEQCTMADILTTVIANWSPKAKKPIHFGPKTKALFSTVVARPSYKKAMETESITYKVAA